MFPTFPHLSEAIAAERAADLQREAEAYRRARGLRRGRGLRGALVHARHAGARPSPRLRPVPVGPVSASAVPASSVPACAAPRHDSCAAAARVS